MINWRAFLAYGVAFMLLFIAVLMLAIASSILLAGIGVPQANAALMAVVWTLMPVWFASSYASYRGVFGDDGPGGFGPGKSSTMQP